MRTRSPADAPACLRALDPYLLHHGVLGPLLDIPDTAVSYVHSLAEAEEAVEREDFEDLIRGESLLP